MCLKTIYEVSKSKIFEKAVGWFNCTPQLLLVIVAIPIVVTYAIVYVNDSMSNQFERQTKILENINKNLASTNEEIKEMKYKLSEHDKKFDLQQHMIEDCNTKIVNMINDFTDFRVATSKANTEFGVRLDVYAMDLDKLEDKVYRRK